MHHQSISRLETSIQRVDHLNLYVGNARHAAHYFRTAFGFTPIAYAGPETGVRDRISLVIEQDSIRLVLTSPTSSSGEIASHLARHGDGVRDIAFAVKNTQVAFDRALAAGARPVSEPLEQVDEHGKVVTATVAAFGDTQHSFVERQDYKGPFLPGFAPIQNPLRSVFTGLQYLDHLAACVEQGTIDFWVDYYRNALGMELVQKETISSDYSGMQTEVVRAGEDKATLVLVEPRPGQRSSPIQEYLNYYDGPGVHHIALSTSNIVETVGALRENGVEFPRTPDTYYEVLLDRVGHLDYQLEDLRRQNILVDKEETGHLLQIFTKPAQARPTYFFEIIERREARGFGSGNVKALYESIEREQAARGNTW